MASCPRQFSPVGRISPVSAVFWWWVLSRVLWLGTCSPPLPVSTPRPGPRTQTPYTHCCVPGYSHWSENSDLSAKQRHTPKISHWLWNKLKGAGGHSACSDSKQHIYIPTFLKMVQFYNSITHRDLLTISRYWHEYIGTHADLANNAEVFIADIITEVLIVASSQYWGELSTLLRCSASQL